MQKNSQGNHAIKTNIASAENEADTEIIDNCKKSRVQYCISIRPTSASSSTKTVSILRINIYTTESWSTTENLSVHLTMKEQLSGLSVLDKTILSSEMQKVDSPYSKSNGFGQYTIPVLVNKELNPDTDYVTTVDSMSIVKVNNVGGVTTVLATSLATAITIKMSTACLVFLIPGIGQVALATLAAATLAAGAVYVYSALIDPVTNKEKFDIQFKTPPAAKDGEGPNITVGDKTYRGSTGDTIMPGCSMMPAILDEVANTSGTFMGCVAQLFYYAVFVPTSFLFALGGKFFDFALHYSIQDSSYRTPFVTEGWKIVRDLCNIFFIFLLLSAAVKMILDIGHGAKDMIVKVVIIGLLINFSLFTTQIVIDASNILTRLFYNSDAINIVVKNGQNSNGNGSVSSYVYGQNGQLPLSAALVDKVDPQAIILNAKNINIQSVDNGKVTNPNAADMEAANQGIGVGPFFLVTLLAVAINLIGFFVFISVALIFVGRVVGLWFSMIFVPLAFFSYAAPDLPEGLKRFGWKGWWAELIGTAMLAPVFMFMMYLILLFLSKGFMGLFYSNAQGAEFVLQTLVPFIVIMILLWQAKSVASDMSKGVASSVTTGLKVAGGAALALGGAGVGWAGRSVIRKISSKASAGTTSTQEYEAASRAEKDFGDSSLMQAYNKKRGFVGRNLGKLGTKIGMHKVFGQSTIGGGKDPTTGQILPTEVGGVMNGIGGRINKAQKKVGDIVHANHEYEKIAKELHLDPKIPYKDLGAVDKAAVDKKFRDSKRADTENNIKKGLVSGVPGENDYIKDQGNLARATSEYSADRKAEITQDFLLKNNATSVAGLSTDKKDALAAKIAAPLTESDNNKIKNKLTTEYKETVLKHETDHKLDYDLDHMAENSAKSISIKDRLSADSTRGTYNPLNLSKLDSIKNDAFATKLIFGITSAVAVGMRTGMKNIPQVNMGTGSGEFKDDFKNAFAEAIKGANFKMESAGGGGGHGGGHDDHGGGHDDHGHGGH
ncbi:MAG: hypothetical protein WC089_02965 [Candidatus Paceibacterota bacterium]